jgi:hypothetical protein
MIHQCSFRREENVHDRAATFSSEKKRMSAHRQKGIHQEEMMNGEGIERTF